MLGDDLSLALLNRAPVQFARVHTFDAEFLGVLQVVPEFGIEQQCLGRNTADVQAGAAEEAVFFDECGLEAPLASADGGRVSGGATADDGYVVCGFGQSCDPH